VPPAKFLRVLRLERAKELLETSYLSVKQVMVQVGVTDGSHFVRNFKLTIDKDTFVNEPNLVMQPTASYQILARGMREGWFRKRKNKVPFKLSDFIKEGSPPDYKGARNIINHPSSSADKFAGFAEKFELILRASLVS